MYTKYPDVFVNVKRNLRGNIAVENLKRRWSPKDRDIEILIDQVILETLDVMEHNKHV